MAEATLRLSRVGSMLNLGGLSEKAWDITIDSRLVGSIAKQETVELAVTPGRHTLRLGRGRHISPLRTFDVAEAELVSYRCHAPRFWPSWVAATIKPDWWITLRRS
jgi:hypothetical protein